MAISNTVMCQACERAFARSEFSGHKCDPKVDNRELNERLIRIDEKLADARKYRGALLTLFDDSCRRSSMDCAYIKEVCGKALGFVRGGGDE